MSDYLVKLWELPSPEPYYASLREKNIVIRKPIGPENYAVIGWIRENFGAGWASESENAFFRDPKGIYIAVREGDGGSEMLGFACYDATVKGFFGPTGVAKSERHQGIGAALLLACLCGMRDEGYGYAVIGSVGPAEFYKKICGATEIEDSSPGVYRGMLRA